MCQPDGTTDVAGGRIISLLLLPAVAESRLKCDYQRWLYGSGEMKSEKVQCPFAHARSDKFDTGSNDDTTRNRPDVFHIYTSTLGSLHMK